MTMFSIEGRYSDAGEWCVVNRNLRDKTTAERAYRGWRDNARDIGLDVRLVEHEQPRRE